MISVFLVLLTVAVAIELQETERRVLIGVTGMFAEGMDLRERLDWVQPQQTEKHVKAIYVGDALVRGYKAYFNIERSLPNAVVFPTGCNEDSHIFSFYLVPPDQVFLILANGPHDLTVNPNGGPIDLTASETSDDVKRLATEEIHRLELSDKKSFSAPLVTGAWFDAKRYIEMPNISTKFDGTRVTDFVKSLALWTGANSEDLIAADFKRIDERNLSWKTVSQRLKEVQSTDLRTSSIPKMCNHLYLNYPIIPKLLDAIDAGSCSGSLEV